MARFEIETEPEYGIYLTQAELNGLFSMLNSGLTVDTIENLYLKDLWIKLERSNLTHKLNGTWHSLGEYK